MVMARGRKLSPLTVTFVPPEAGPVSGSIEVT